MVPGLLARNRYNYVEDQQVSIRGIGANSTFGIRGVRVYHVNRQRVADCQGQISQFNLDSASRVEALDVVRAQATPRWSDCRYSPPTDRSIRRPPSLVYGSFDWRASLNALGSAGGLGYNLDYTHFQVDGFRDHSAAKNDFNGKL